jgi:uncharacterized LabA/DUF88 family protein
VIILEDGKETRQKRIIIDADNIFVTGEDLRIKWNYPALFRLFIGEKENTKIYFCYRPQEVTIGEENNGFLGFLNFISNSLWWTLDNEGIIYKDFPAVKQDVDSLVNIKIGKFIIEQLRQKSKRSEDRVEKLEKINQRLIEEIKKLGGEGYKLEIDVRVDQIKEIKKTLILFSGDGGYCELLNEARRENIDIEIVAGKESCSESLKKIANKVHYLEDLFKDYPILAFTIIGNN